MYICSGEWSACGEGTPLLHFHDIILQLFDHVHWKVFFLLWLKSNSRLVNLGALTFWSGGMSEIIRHPIVDNHSHVVNQYSLIQNHYDLRDFNYHHHQLCERGPQSPTISRDHSSMSEVIPVVNNYFHNPRTVFKRSGRVRQVCFDPGDFNCHQNQQHGRGPTFPRIILVLTNCQMPYQL